MSLLAYIFSKDTHQISSSRSSRLYMDTCRGKHTHLYFTYICLNLIIIFTLYNFTVSRYCKKSKIQRHYWGDFTLGPKTIGNILSWTHQVDPHLESYYNKIVLCISPPSINFSISCVHFGDVALLSIFSKQETRNSGWQYLDISQRYQWIFPPESLFLSIWKDVKRLLEYVLCNLGYAKVR